LKRVLVLGSGIAGTAAALSAARAGGAVSVVSAGPGASVLAGGAIDALPWESGGARATPLGPDERAVLDALDAFFVGDASAVVATASGILRPARGRDVALLDLAALHDAEVLVPDVDWRWWDATALARAWSEAPEARARRIRFTTAPVPIVRQHAEQDLGDADMAALHDAPERLAWLAARLADAPRAGAILLPPWLGVERARAASLTASLGVPCGEAAAGPGGPSGLRFENARDRALAAARVERIAGHIVTLSSSGTWRARLESGQEVPPCDAVVVATGGLVGGGLAYSPMVSKLTVDASTLAGPLVRATLDAPLLVGIAGAPLLPPSSSFGATPEAHAWPFVEDSPLEQAGVLVGEDGSVRGAPGGLFAAGALVADRPRTWLDALTSGVVAGRAAARS
jgi:glycerol-3-phosphate dehydrogenase subunit B